MKNAKLIKNNKLKLVMKTKNPFKVYEQLFLDPNAFFKTVAKETDAVMIAAFVGLFLLAGQILEFVAWIPTLSIHAEAEYLPTVLFSVMGILIHPILTLLFTLLLAGLVHLGVSYFKKGSSFFATWKVLTYATLIPIAYSVSLSIVQTILEAVNPWPEQSMFVAEPSWGLFSILIFVLMFLVSLVMLIHSIYTEVVGLKIYHKLTTTQALIAIIAPVLLFVLIVVLLFGSLLFVAQTLI